MYYILSLIIVLIIALFMIIKHYSFKTHESFDNSSISSFLGMTFETGTSPITPTGSISFTKEYTTIPIIFTQIITNGGDDASNAFSIQVFNITQKGFDYSKNILKNNVIHPSEGNDMVALNLTQDSLNSFQWIAFG
jgi:hypothetical protein